MRLELIDLSKNYGDVLALKGINYIFTEGIYGILGANGAGKSTLFNILTDNLKRQSGSVLLDEKEVLSDSKKYRSLIGYLPQQQGFYDKMSVISYMKYVAGLKGIKRLNFKVQSKEILERVNMWENRYKLMGSLSGGMRQRALIACTFLGNPKILILDEPSAGLDPKERVDLRSLIKSMSKDKIILISTHIVSDVENMADSIVIMKKGNIVASGTNEELMQSFKVDNLEEVYLKAVNEGERNTVSDVRVD